MSLTVVLLRPKQKEPLKKNFFLVGSNGKFIQNKRNLLNVPSQRVQKNLFSQIITSNQLFPRKQKGRSSLFLTLLRNHLTLRISLFDQMVFKSIHQTIQNGKVFYLIRPYQSHFQKLKNGKEFCQLRHSKGHLKSLRNHLTKGMHVSTHLQDLQKNTFSKHTNKRVKSYNPRTGQKHTFSSKPQTMPNVRVNDKKFTCQCQC